MVKIKKVPKRLGKSIEFGGRRYRLVGVTAGRDRVAKSVKTAHRLEQKTRVVAVKRGDYYPTRPTGRITQAYRKGYALYVSD